MSDKIRLSMITDFACSSGFASVSHQIAKYLKQTDLYDIKILGINYHGTPHPMAREFDVWPAKLGGDFLGVGYTRPFIQETNPDVVYILQDFWNIPLYIGQMAERGQERPGLVCYYPVDSPNVKGEYMVAMAAAVDLVCYTDFGIDESVRGAQEAYTVLRDMAKHNNIDYTANIQTNIKAGVDISSETRITLGVSPYRLKQLTRPETYHKIPHGIDMEMFHQLDREQVRKEFGLDKEFFIVGNVNRNQSRKRQDLSIRTFAKFAKDKPNARLLIHANRGDVKGWDLSQLGNYYGVSDKILFTAEIFPQRTATIEQLNKVYNLIDVQINTGGGEGWGLTSFEGAACKVPQVVPDWSATKEIWEGSAKLIEVAEVRHEPYSINTMQSVISTDNCAAILQEMYDDPALCEKVGEDCYQVTQRPEYSWETIGEQFDELLLNAVGQRPSRTPVAFTPKGVQELKKKGVIK